MPEPSQPSRNASAEERRAYHEEMERDYKITRVYFRGGKRTIKRGLTLWEAQDHCRDPETSSSTAKGAKARRITRTHGRWFDAYERDR